MSALSRFPVKAIRVKKKTSSPEHEFLLINVRDSQDSQDRNFILERTVNLKPSRDSSDKHDNHGDPEIPNHSTISNFFMHLDCKKVLDALSRTMQRIPPSVLAAGAAVVAGPALSCFSAPVVTSAAIPLSIASTFLCAPSSSTPYLPCTNPIAEVPQSTIIYQASLSIIQLLQFMSDFSVSECASDSLSKSKPPKDAQADNCWLAGV